MTPEQVVAVKFTKDGVSLFFTILRMLATRKLPRTRQSILANIFLLLTFATDFSSTAIFVYVMFEQRKIMDRHGGDMKLADAEIGREDLAEVFFVSILLYYIALYALKGAWLAYYAQLFIQVDSKKRYTLYAGALITAVSFLIGLGLHFFWCWPFLENFNPHSTTPHCPTVFNFEAFSALSVMNIISDFAIMGIPVVVISSLRLDFRERIGLVVVFLVGGSSVISSIVRFGVVGKLFHDKVYTWNTSHIFALLSHAECMFGIIAFSLPAFRRFLRSREEMKRGRSGGSKGLVDIDTPRSREMRRDPEALNSVESVRSWKTERS